MSRVLMEAPQDEVVVLSVSGVLDAQGARDLLRMTATAAASGMRVVEVDLSHLRTYTPGAVFAITGCRRLARLLRGRVRIVPGQGAGRDLWNLSVLAAP